MTTADLAGLLENVAARMMRLSSDSSQVRLPIDITNFECWEWPQGVGLYALYRHAEITRSTEQLAWIEGWYARRLREGLPEKNVNTMAPMLTLACVGERTKLPGTLELCREWADWVLERMPRTEEGGLQHIATGSENQQQLWADTLFMTVLFMAKMGAMLGRDDYLEEAIRQFLLHVKYLSDPRTGLWFHGWTFKGRHHFSRALWARGNSWFTSGAVDFLEMVGPPTGVAAHLRETLASQVRGLALVQSRDGMWHTLLDDPNSYVEASATAAFGYGILKGVRLGFLSRKYEPIGWRALEAVVGRIDAEGTVHDVSFGTGIGDSLDYYRNIPQCPMPYGQALTLLVLGEALRHPIEKFRRPKVR